MRSLVRCITALCSPALLAVAGCADTIGSSPDAPTPAKPAVTSPAASAPSASDKEASLPEAVDRLAVRPESRTGYEREKFHHWVDADRDGCDTRKEVLISEATKKPRQGGNCELTGGEWQSYYDGKTITDDSKLDIDHMVPLAEAWDSGASKWNVEKREQYANDLTVPRSLVAVTLSTNRSKGDQDVAEWLPPTSSVHCLYATDWVSTKLRWKLTVDTAEHATLVKVARRCPDAVATARPAP